MAAADGFDTLTWETGDFLAGFAGFGADFSGTLPSEAAFGLETGLGSMAADSAPAAADFRFDATSAGLAAAIGSTDPGRTGVRAGALSLVTTEGTFADLPALPRAAGESDGVGWAATAFFTGGGAD